MGNATTKFLFGVFFLALHLLSLRIWFIFNIDLSSCWSSLCWFSLTQIYTYICVLSSTAFTYSYVFSFESFELSECDRTLTSSMLLPQILSIQIICILLKPSNVFSASLSAEDTETNIESVLNAQSLLPKIRRSRNDHATVQACVGTWNNFQCVACMPCVLQMWLRCGVPFLINTQLTAVIISSSTSPPRTNPSASASSRRRRRRSA